MDKQIREEIHIHTENNNVCIWRYMTSYTHFKKGMNDHVHQE